MRTRSKVDQGGKVHIIVIFCLILIGSGFWAIPAVAASPLDISRPKLLHLPMQAAEPCELPESGLVLSGEALGLPLFNQGGAGAVAGSPQLVITCLRFDRSHYTLGMQWTAEFAVTNVGNGPSNAFEITGHLCRYMENGITFTCMTSIFYLGQYGGSLAPGESVLLTSEPNGFPLALDPPGSYPSWETGLPDNGIVYLRARVDTMPLGQYAVTNAVYPSAPSDASEDPNFIDEDLDGWTPAPNHPLGVDCNDSDPDVHPGALEYPNDGVDNDCSGGDVALPEDCELVYGAIHGLDTTLCSHPGAYPGGSRDLDGDGYFDTETAFSTPDCDDNNPFINPGMGELPDGIDNNCNGLIDEGYGIPDWVIDSVLVERTFEAPHAAAPYQLPGLRFQIEVGNVGYDLGSDLSLLGNGVRLRRGIDNVILAPGLEGFAPYTQLPQGDIMACYTTPMYGQVLHTGIFGETNFSNNEWPLQIPPYGQTDLDVRFNQHPNFEYQHGSTQLTVHSNLEMNGTCPPLPLWAGVTPFVYINAKVMVSNIYTGEETWDSPQSVGLSAQESTTFNLPQPLSHNDIVCLELRLDPDLLIAEDHDDNMSVQILQYKKPLIGPGHFDTYIPAYMGPPGAVSYPNNTCKDVSPPSSGGALIGGSPVVLGLFAGAVLVAVLGGLGGRVAGVGVDRVGWIVAGGIVVGAVGGGFAADILARSSNTAPTEATSIKVEPSTTNLLPSCDLYLDPDSANPVDGEKLPRFKEAALLSIDFRLDPPEPVPTSFEIRLTSPSGQEAIFRASNTDGNGTLRLDLGKALSALGSDLLSESGEFVWSLLSGTVYTGGDLVPFVDVCSGSSAHRFIVVTPIPDFSNPTETPTATIPSVIPPTITSVEPAVPPPTRTPKPTSPPPTRTPIPPKKGPTSTPNLP